MNDSIYGGLFRGAAWTIAARWLLRLIGLVNLIILARLLEPSDLGLMAMALLVTTFASNFTQAGAQQLLIRQRDISRDDINAAWTIHILQALGVSALVLIAAPAAGSYFGDTRVESILRVIALAPLIRGFRNIGLTLARRELDFSPEFHTQVISKTAETVITLSLVLWWQSYWALVVGNIFGAVIMVVVSYRLHPYRPSICSRNLRPYLRFAGSIVPLRIARYGNDRGAVVVAAGMATSSQFGLFNLAYELSSLLWKEVVTPLSRGFFPSYARLGHDRNLLAGVFTQMLNLSAVILLPAGVGMALVAADFIPVVLGPQWLDTVGPLQWFAFAGALAGINQMMNVHILIAAGHETRAAITAWIRLCLFLPVIIAAGSLGGGLPAIARVSLYFELSFLPVSALVLMASLPIRLSQLANALLRPLLSSLVMALVVLALQHLPVETAIIRLLLAVGAGLAAYGVCLYSIWRLSGYQAGAESLLAGYIQRRFRPRDQARNTG